MTDLMGFQTTNTNNQFAPNNQNNNFGVNLLSGNNNGGFNALNIQQNQAPQQSFQQPAQQTPFSFQQQPPQNQGGFDFNLLGSSQPQSNVSNPPPQVNNSSGFQPIVNNNPNKILAYENTHLQIWMDCIKESNDTTKVFTTYVNKTNNSLTELNIQAAVLKHVKLVINPLSSTTMQPFSR